LREEHRLRVPENRVLWRIFGLKRDNLTGELRKLRNEELNNLYTSTNIVGEKRGVCRVLVGKPEGKRPFGRPRH
jgi:hypothetical protein